MAYNQVLPGFPLFHEDQIQGLKDFFKHHLFYIKHLSNSHATICNVMKDLTVLNISLTLNIYIKNFRVIMFECVGS